MLSRGIASVLLVLLDLKNLVAGPGVDTDRINITATAEMSGVAYS
jgi:hypothetical protein